MKNRENLRKIMRKALFFSAALVLFAACSKDLNDPAHGAHAQELVQETKQVGDLFINKDALLLEKGDLAKVKTVASDYLLFDSKPAIAEELKVGSILVGAKVKGDQVEQILGRVTAIEAGSSWLLRMEPVKLEEFIYSGTISGSFTPELLDAKALKADGKLQKQSYVPVAGFPVYTEKGGIVKRAETRASISLPRIAYSGTIAIPSTSVGPVGIEPALTLDAGFTPKFDYNIVFQFGRVKSIVITLHAKDMLLDAHLLAYAGLEYAINLSDLYSIPVAPIVLGPTGLVLSPTISAGPYLSFSAGADIDVKLFHGEGEVSYVLTNPTQLPTWNFQIDPYGWENIKVYPQVASEVGLQVNTGFSLTYLMTNVASVNAAPKIGLGSTVSSDDNLQHVNHEIYGVLRADARLLLGVPPFQIEQNYPIINYQPVFYSKEYTLFE